MKIGFIGLGNVGGKLAGSLLRNNFDLTVRDLDENLTNSLKDLGAKVAKSPKELAENSDLIITSLPSPEVSAEVMEADDGIINGLSENKIWLEMSTTDENEVKRIGKKVIEKKLYLWMDLLVADVIELQQVILLYSWVEKETHLKKFYLH